MMELADVTDSKSVGSDTVWVRVPLPAPKIKADHLVGFDFNLKFWDSKPERADGVSKTVQRTVL